MFLALERISVLNSAFLNAVQNVVIQNTPQNLTTLRAHFFLKQDTWFKKEDICLFVHLYVFLPFSPDTSHSSHIIFKAAAQFQPYLTEKQRSNASIFKNTNVKYKRESSHLSEGKALVCKKCRKDSYLKINV